jgi:hypothetical protein
MLLIMTPTPKYLQDAVGLDWCGFQRPRMRLNGFHYLIGNVRNASLEQGPSPARVDIDQIRFETVVPGVFV